MSYLDIEACRNPPLCKGCNEQNVLLNFLYRMGTMQMAKCGQPAPSRAAERRASLTWDFNNELMVLVLSINEIR